LGGERLHGDRSVAHEISGGMRSYGGYADIDALFRDQGVETDRKRRETLLHKIQQLMYERAMFAPIVKQAALTGWRRCPPSRATRSCRRTRISS